MSCHVGISSVLVVKDPDELVAPVGFVLAILMRGFLLMTFCGGPDPINHIENQILE